MKKVFLSILLLLVLFSFSINAVNVDLNSSYSITDFFKDILNVFQGSAQPETIFFVSLAMYFIIFMAIFVEGVKYLPLFGQRGDISTPGKWFAFAASSLATIGIFFGRELNPIDRFRDFIAPFGFWGGVTLGAIFAFIGYNYIKDVGIFGNSVITRVAIAGSIGISIVGFILSMQTLLGWGIAAVIIISLTGIILHLNSEKINLSDKNLEKTITKKKLKIESEKQAELQDLEKEFEEFTIAEFEWLKELKEDVEKSYREGKLGGDTRSKHGIDPRREERQLYLMWQKIHNLTSYLEDFEKIYPDKKVDLEHYIDELNGFLNKLIKIESRNGEFDNVLESNIQELATQEVQNEIEIEKISDENQKKNLYEKVYRAYVQDKYNHLISLLDEAIKMDQAIVAVLKEVKKLIL